MLPHPLAANPADVVQFFPDKVRRVSSATNQWSRNSITATAVGMEEVLIAGMQLWRDALRTSLNLIVASRCSLNRRYLLSLVLPILSKTLTVQSRVWMCPLLLFSLAVRPWSLQPAQNQDLWPRERRRTNSTGINLVLFILETTGRPGPHARKFVRFLTRDADNPPLAIRDTWSTVQSVLRSAVSKQQLTAVVA